MYRLLLWLDHGEKRQTNFTYQLVRVVILLGMRIDVNLSSPVIQDMQATCHELLGLTLDDSALDGTDYKFGSPMIIPN